jgi:hypothetical protein
LHALIQRGLMETHGSYRAMLALLNLPPTDYKRLLSFLRQHNCHVPFQSFREGRLRAADPDRQPARRAGDHRAAG